MTFQVTKKFIYFKRLKLIYLFTLICFYNCNSQNNVCKSSNNNIKTEIIETYNANFLNGKFVVTDKKPSFIDNYSYNSKGVLLKYEGTTYLEDGEFKSVINYTYDDELLQKINKSTYHNDEIVDELSEELTVIKYNVHKKPILINSKKASINKIYTYKNCLEHTEKIIDLAKNELVKEKIMTYDEKGNLISITTEYNFDEKVTDKMLFINYEFNKTGDWIYRVIERSDNTYLIEKRDIVYK